MQHIPISPLFAPRRPGRKSRVHTLYYIHRTAIAYAYHTESPLLSCVRVVHGSRARGEE
jgi:hypothetical protein